ncbi:MAG: DUF1571 domain-containing protein [Bacteroidia bacterium]|nr:DUF1571 domain-containing protein [Bacteroidia bacterium]
MKIFLLLALQALTIKLSAQNPEPSCHDIVTKSLTSIKEVKGLKYHLKITERGKKGMNYYESAVKFSRNPRLIYLYIKGIEVLWLQGKNNGKALVKPNSFPFFNLNLDPMGDLMRQDQHHTLNEMGYDYFASIIQNTVDKLGPAKFNEVFKYGGLERINGRPCYKIIIDNKDFGYVDYTIGDNENITSIARKHHIAEYMILEKNKKFKDYFDILKKGEVIKIPNWYCRSVVMFVDQLYFLPISLKVLDDKGLFEEYNYHFLQVNPKFEEGEFTRNYKEYGF